MWSIKVIGDEVPVFKGSGMRWLLSCLCNAISLFSNYDTHGRSNHNLNGDLAFRTSIFICNENINFLINLTFNSVTFIIYSSLTLSVAPLYYAIISSYEN